MAFSYILVSELVEGAKNGSLKEIFGAGTAAVVNPIVGFSYQDVYYELPKIENSVALRIKAYSLWLISIKFMIYKQKIWFNL